VGTLAVLRTSWKSELPEMTSWPASPKDCARAAEEENRATVCGHLKLTHLGHQKLTHLAAIAEGMGRSATTA
jgi:hypothetical protein